MSDKKIKWTEQQKLAIEQRGRSLIVTASAGTGKTAVLSQRCVEIISDKTTCPDIRNILVLTFTEAAAEQMRSRIGERLKKASLKDDGGRLRSQLLLLPGADIGTIHWFCRRIITRHFYQLGLDPAFGIIDADEQKLLKNQALEKTIEWAWEQDHLSRGLERLLCRRSLDINNGFLSKIIGLSDFLDSVVWRGDWYKRVLRLSEAVNPFDTNVAEAQKRIISEKLRYILEQLHHAQSIYENYCSDGQWLEKIQEDFVRPISLCAEFFHAGEWNKCAEQIRAFARPPVNKPKGIEEPADEFIQKTVRKAVDSFCELSTLAVLNPDYIEKVAGASSLQTKLLVELVRKFDDFYTQLKQNVNCLDFADLEHYALKLLTAGDFEDGFEVSQVALDLRARYKHIFVDEYQDINGVQQAIIEAVSSSDNLFVVGDVKQSIYAFRGAAPDIFVEQLRAASTDSENGSSSLRVDLNSNFRSAEPILDFVNTVFSRIMTEGVARIDYKNSSQLEAGSQRQLKPSDGPAVELHILDKKSQYHGQKNLYTARRYQAAMIGRRIRKMVGADNGKAEFEIFDQQSGKMRPVEYRDIVILMRSPGKRVNDYLEVLSLAGVPVSSRGSSGYFLACEITDCLCLLKILDNLRRDIELAAVLRSPFFGVSDSELAKIKTADNSNSKSFYQCLIEYSANGADSKLAQRLKKILEQLNRWQRIARRGNLVDLIWRIFRETNFPAFVSALPNGRTRKANLLKLHDRAIQFASFATSGRIPSLGRFVEFIEKIQEANSQWETAEPEAATENAVRIMSVHKSKGLEFSVVFLAELNAEFNTNDMSDDLLADPAGALGMQVIDRGANAKLSCLAHQVIAEKTKAANLAEEMRILYVAMTRAADRLILTASEKKKTCQQILCDGLLGGGRTIADWQGRSCRNHLAWILYGLCEQRVLHRIFETGVKTEACEDNLFDARLYGGPEVEQLAEYVDALTKIKQSRSKAKQASEPGLLAGLKESLNWQYKFDHLTKLPAKDTVTRLTHRDDEFSKTQFSDALDRIPKAFGHSISADAVDSRLIGTAAHLVLASVDLSVPPTALTIAKTVKKLLARQAITEAVAERIDTESILAFFQSESGRQVLGAERLWREWQFSYACPAVADVPTIDAAEEQTVIVQGIVDMIAQTDHGLLIIDFKSDKITAEQAQGRALLYSRQLDLYAVAAEKILKQPIAEKCIYFLTPGKKVKS